MKFFAGPRDDPFFFDLVNFKQFLEELLQHLIGYFCGSNVLSVVVEVPKTMLGTASTFECMGRN
jgi:hypothetical protein